MQSSVAIDSGVLKIAMSGKFTFADGTPLMEFCDDISRKKLDKVEVDLSGVDFIDSAALGMLLLIRDKCQKYNASLLLKGPKGQVKQMFDISRFYDLFKIENAV